MASDWITEAVTELDQLMLNRYHAYRGTIISHWEQFPGNDGQMVIVQNHILPAAYNHASEATNQWPYGPNPDDLADALWSCYDQDVLARAFSDSIEECVGAVYEYWIESMDFQNEHEELVAIIGESYEPHSTDPSWMGPIG